MARKKQRENYGTGSISPVMLAKLDKDGNPVLDPSTGKPQKVQQRDKQGRLVWRICVTLGTEEYTDSQGRARKRQLKAPQKVFHGTLEEARATCRQLAEQYEHVSKDSAKLTFSAAAKAWEDSMRNANRVTRSTLANYVYAAGIMEEQIGAMPLLEVREHDIDKAIAGIRASGRGNTTVCKVFAATKRIFNFALQREWIVRNPLTLMDSPKAARIQTRLSLSAEEAARLRAVLDAEEHVVMREFAEKENRMCDWASQRANGGDKLWGRGQVRGISRLSCVAALRIILATGMRRGEALALAWECIDLDGGSIQVIRSLSKDMELKEPKSRAGVRTIAIDSDTVAHLRAWKETQRQALLRVRTVNADGSTSAVKQDGNTPVCCNDAGGLMDYYNLSRWWRAFREAHGFCGLKIHELRHTAATLLLGNGVDVKTVQTRLGHATSAITLDFYAHAIPANDKAAADLIGGILGSPARASAEVIALPTIAKTA
ncbi:MAG: tyrosine-type recombinase/integrase [Coriobacteriia bacterium]|nr:tyrosine-type recombinase/integrase [Coriobacteriia bacterium]